MCILCLNRPFITFQEGKKIQCRTRQNEVLWHKATSRFVTVETSQWSQEIPAARLLIQLCKDAILLLGDNIQAGFAWDRDQSPTQPLIPSQYLQPLKLVANPHVPIAYAGPLWAQYKSHCSKSKGMEWGDLGLFLLLTLIFEKHISSAPLWSKAAVSPILTSVCSKGKEQQMPFCDCWGLLVRTASALSYRKLPALHPETFTFQQVSFKTELRQEKRSGQITNISLHCAVTENLCVFLL